MSGKDETLRGVDIVLTQYEVCCYALVVSLTAIGLCDPPRRNARLERFNQALDDFENGLFEIAVRRAKEATAPDIAGPPAGIEHDLEALRARLHRMLAQRPGRA
jgi:hypothetical protein